MKSALVVEGVVLVLLAMASPAVAQQAVAIVDTPSALPQTNEARLRSTEAPVSLRSSAAPVADTGATSASPSTQPVRLFRGVGLAVLADVSESPNIVIGLNWNALVFGLGTNMSYQSNGAASADAQQSQPASFALGAVAAMQFMVYNRAPVAFGPEVTFVTNLRPGRAFESNLIATGIGFWYAPFNAPILLGTAWNARISFEGSGHDTTVTLATPSLRLGFGLP